MTLFDKMRRAFGLGSDEDEELEVAFRDDEQPDATAPADTADVPTSGAPAPGADTAADSAEDDALALSAEMMAGVVELFNSFQPEFIARCLDSERQQRLIAENMAPALRVRLAAIVAAEKERVDRVCADERSALDSDLKKLRDRNAELERRRSEFKDQELSASRQKRALKERVHDLEQQVERLESEKEQLDLENRSMANKLRASGIAGTPAPEAPQPAPVPDRSAEIEALEAEKSRLTEANEALKERCRMADGMTTDLRHRLAEAEKAAEEARAAAEEAARKAADNAVDATQEEVDELRRQVELLQGIAEKAEQFADITEKKDARIAELKNRIREAEKDLEELPRLRDENRSLRNTIEANLYEHASEMAELRRSLEASKPRRGRPRKQRPADEPEAAPDLQPEAVEKKPRKSRQPKISAIDELIESNEWLMAPTPEELAAPHAEEPSDDFGYHAPVHKPTIHDDSSQLTLF